MERVVVLVAVAMLNAASKAQDNTTTVQWIALWCFAAFFMLVALCGVFPLDQIDHENNTVESTFFNTFHRPVWALGVGLMVLACSTGYGGLFGAGKSSNRKELQPSKLTATIEKQPDLEAVTIRSKDPGDEPQHIKGAEAEAATVNNYENGTGGGHFLRKSLDLGDSF